MEALYAHGRMDKVAELLWLEAARCVAVGGNFSSPKAQLQRAYSDGLARRATTRNPASYSCLPLAVRESENIHLIIQLNRMTAVDVLVTHFMNHALNLVASQTCEQGTELRRLLRCAADEYECAVKYGHRALESSLAEQHGYSSKTSRCFEMSSFAAKAGHYYSEAAKSSAGEQEVSQRAAQLFTRAAELTSMSVLFEYEPDWDFDWSGLCAVTDVAGVFAAAAQEPCETSHAEWDPIVHEAEELACWRTEPSGRRTVILSPDYNVRREGVMLRAIRLESRPVELSETRRVPPESREHSP